MKITVTAVETTDTYATAVIFTGRNEAGLPVRVAVNRGNVADEIAVSLESDGSIVTTIEEWQLLDVRGGRSDRLGLRRSRQRRSYTVTWTRSKRRWAVGRNPARTIAVSTGTAARGKAAWRYR